MADEPAPAPVAATPAEVPPIAPVPGARTPLGTPTPGLSFSPGLRHLPNSQAPSLPDGTMVNHVFGPGQAPVDPIAAGLDLGYNPLTRAENRIITQTGTIGAGPRPATYAHVGGAAVPQAGISDHSNVPAPSDSEVSTPFGPADAPLVAAHAEPSNATANAQSGGATPAPHPVVP